ncbi:hypothetical protein [Flavobacterium sp.]|uniref:hypothetical protein n=1 Tax=Flavobacterium sp. TaxID=239 RepID=UPI0025C1E562|nr:hypothetical protein [Flavobacterium sp.]MBA4277318.1 hypothetical protein [Flavobacterium sp.]
MKKFSYIILFSFLISACHKKETSECDSLKSYIYSNATESKVYTAKLTCEDTVFLTEYYPTQQSFFALNGRKQKLKIDSLVNQVDFKNIQNEYFEASLQDGQAFRIIIQNQNKFDSIFVYGRKAPKIINQISSEFKKMLKSLTFVPYPKDINYGKHHIKLLPPPPPPKIVDTIIFKKN